ncbi:MAG: phospholipase [Muribaculaceae bacterium]|nr:phospholipase [Muribaculaceae bacterium]MDE6118276.1 phospholipase [Muribaculaceae bacterium]MDE6316447.1 phospholipase [Muribaculaceae bacterium]
MITVFCIILGALVAVGFALWLTHKPVQEPEEEALPEEEIRQADADETDEEECCGQHQICERESLLAAVSKKIEYFDDEELDRFQGKRPEEYTDEEADEFRQVMLSMREDEVAAWARSLQLRGLELPEPVREELLLIVSELRG